MKVVVVVANQKESVDEVKSSVARREEYVLQVRGKVALPPVGSYARVAVSWTAGFGINRG